MDFVVWRFLIWWPFAILSGLGVFLNWIHSVLQMGFDHNVLF